MIIKNCGTAKTITSCISEVPYTIDWNAMIPAETVEQAIEYAYEHVVRYRFSKFEVLMSIDVMRAGNWHAGQKITRYKLPIRIVDFLLSYKLKDSFQCSDIELVGKPINKRKFKRYDRHES